MIDFSSSFVDDMKLFLGFSVIVGIVAIFTLVGVLTKWTPNQRIENGLPILIEDKVYKCEVKP